MPPPAQYLSAEQAAASKYEVPKSANWCAGNLLASLRSLAVCCCADLVVRARADSVCHLWPQPPRRRPKWLCRSLPPLGSSSGSSGSFEGSSDGSDLLSSSDGGGVAAAASLPALRLALDAAWRPAVVWAVAAIYFALLLLPLLPRPAH